MKFIVFLGLLGLTTALEPQLQKVELLRSNQELNDDGSFSYGYELDDGTKVEQSGYLKNAGTKEEGLFIQGSYAYVEPKGETIVTRYVADEGGFQPEGDHLPTPPPIPEYVKRLLAILYKNAAEQIEKVQHF